MAYNSILSMIVTGSRGFSGPREFGASSVFGAPPKKASERQQANWATEWSEKVGVNLEYQFDSSGPDAWDSAAHPLVFITTEGPGYGGLLSGVTLPGLAIIDADTREVVASAN